MIFKKFFGSTPAAILISASIVLTGCSKSAEPDAANANGANRSSSPAVLNNTASVSNVSASNNNSTGVGNAATNNSAAANDAKKPTPPVKGTAAAPTPNIGSGGADMFLLTSIRGALAADKELSTAVIVGIKEGTATLTGSVSNQEQKAKAEQLVKGVPGVKSVQNSLRVSPR